MIRRIVSSCAALAVGSGLTNKNNLANDILHVALGEVRKMLRKVGTLRSYPFVTESLSSAKQCLPYGG